MHLGILGAWGPAIFSNDTACDDRDGYRDLLGDGVDPEEATRRLISEWREAIDDPELGGVFWMALAATQWSLGRLADRVRDQALKVIGRVREREFPADRLARLGVAGPLPRGGTDSGPRVFLWRSLDQRLRCGSLGNGWATRMKRRREPLTPQRVK